MAKQDKTEIKTGFTTVKVFRVDIDERTKRRTEKLIHEGVVIGQTSSFVRVYSAAPVDKGGDYSPEMSQLYPIKSARCWVEVTGQKTQSFPIPPTFL